jgi:hypothetical protein
MWLVIVLTQSTQLVALAVVNAAPTPCANLFQWHRFADRLPRIRWALFTTVAATLHHRRRRRRHSPTSTTNCLQWSRCGKFETIHLQPYIGVKYERWCCVSQVMIVLALQKLIIHACHMRTLSLFSRVWYQQSSWWDIVCISTIIKFVLLWLEVTFSWN